MVKTVETQSLASFPGWLPVKVMGSVASFPTYGTDVPASESSGAISAYVLAPDRKRPGQARETLGAVLEGAVVSGLARRARLGVPQRVRSLGTRENRGLQRRQWQQEGTGGKCERNIHVRGVSSPYSLTKAAVEERGNGNSESTNAVLDSNTVFRRGFMYFVVMHGSSLDEHFPIELFKPSRSTLSSTTPRRAALTLSPTRFSKTVTFRYRRYHFTSSRLTLAVCGQ